ncbi:ARF GTPase-activating protein GIT1 [Rhodnius prolixus]|uniref:Arf-GAP domain-containing protein n=2 Tax=Rhodnius TaxID=13248 RepID=A0A905QWQ7_RHOPR
MSSNKLIKQADICADCGSLDPPWALINRGLLVCDECCSIHRSLGRNISVVKSLKRSPWSISQLKMLHALNNAGVNSIWEHSLSEMKSKKKPIPKDPLLPNKADFIRAKHQDLQFISKSSDTEEELNLQLHSIVRTANLETTLRLLAQGADPNFLHPEKGSRVLHVAAKAGQLYQVELLFINGADIMGWDSLGNTAAHVARAAGHREVMMRMVEMMYTVTDKLLYFLTRLKPDHNVGQHFIQPTERDCLVNPVFPPGAARVFQLTNEQFEELVMDVYDEVDRRETETIWLSSGASLEYSTVPFLPVDPYLSPTRNQGRQKLARLTPNEFSALVLDVLQDAYTRQSDNSGVRTDEEPLYDSVASDDDYATAEQLAIMVAQNSRGLPLMLSEPAKSSSAKTESAAERELREKLVAAQAREAQLSAQIQRLNKRVDEANIENERLKRSLKSSVVDSSSPADPVSEMRVLSSVGVSGMPSPSHGLQPGHSGRPVSMYEARDSLRVQNVLPLSEEVVRRTNLVTKRIQELWSAVKPPESNFVYVPCAERIRVAVAELTAIFPQKPQEEIVRNALYQLNTSTARLQVECAELEKCAESVRSLAFNIADANRQLVTRFK